jgi:hypothetical protein
MAVIRVPKTPRSAFDRGRKPSQLLKDQLTHFEWAVRPASERGPGDFRPKAARTEGQTAARIADLTRQLLERQQAAPALPPAAVPAAAGGPPPAPEQPSPPSRATSRPRSSSSGAGQPSRLSHRAKPRSRKRR